MSDWNKVVVEPPGTGDGELITVTGEPTVVITVTGEPDVAIGVTGSGSGAGWADVSVPLGTWTKIDV